jgi:beta-lactamase regulating signal transducer with metallopeptidase domain
MSPVYDYLIKLSASLAVVAAFHHLFLRRLTFYNWNRFYLLIYSALCFVVPLIDINQTIETLPAFSNSSVIKQIPTIHNVSPAPLAPLPAAAQPASFSMEKWILLSIFIGIILMLLRLQLHIIAYMRILGKAQLVSDEDVKIYHVQKRISPFSFGNSIFYNPELHSESELKEIILHEYIHVRQRHTVDIIWGEILCIINWYNPFAWLIRHHIRLNLEYIADRNVLENDVDSKEYQYLLLKVAGGPDFRIANAFTLSSLKQRIVMMNKERTPRLFLISFLFALPILVTLLLVFRGRETEKKDDFLAFWKDAKGLTFGPQALKGEVHIAGLILERRTGRPMANIQLKVSRYNKLVKTISTDAQGFYYDVLPAKAATNKPKGMKYIRDDYQISYDGGEYSTFSFNDHPVYDTNFWSGFRVIFLPTTNTFNTDLDIYSIDKKEILDNYKGNNLKADLKSALLSQTPAFLAEHNLKIDFKNDVPYPKQVLTKYKTGLFDRNKQLIGYEDYTKLMLDGKPATYEDINEAFRDYPFMLDNSKEYRDWDHRGLCTSISYITFDLYKTPPPAALLKGNVEWKDVNEFDLAELKKEPYFLDGFRQTSATGSNLMPRKTDLRKVALFTGRLARYYDPKLERIWWVETRPEAEVFERPDLALKQ